MTTDPEPVVAPQLHTPTTPAGLRQYDQSRLAREQQR